jgi:hypothetical protein
MVDYKHGLGTLFRMNPAILLLAAALCLSPLPTIADAGHKPPEARENVGTQAYADTVQKPRDCNVGGAAEQFECFKEQSQALEKEMDELIKQTTDSYTSSWGPEAIAEGRQRISQGQEHWKLYRDKHCEFDYYSMAPAHPTSQDISMTVCKMAKTRLRITEIRKQYLKQLEEWER